MKGFKGLFPESRGQNLALTVICAIFARKRRGEETPREGDSQGAVVSLDHDVKNKTVKARFGPWLSGKNP